jgi:hypothetical protein
MTEPAVEKVAVRIQPNSQVQCLQSASCG